MSRALHPLLYSGHMEVLGLTIFLSLLLAVFFVAVFFFSQRGSRRGLEQESLLPLNEDEPPQPSTRQP